MFRHVKMIQKMLSYTIRLSVTIQQYKEVPLSLSQRLHSLLKAAYDSKYRMFGRAPNED